MKQQKKKFWKKKKTKDLSESILSEVHLFLSRLPLFGAINLGKYCQPDTKHLQIKIASLATCLSVSKHPSHAILTTSSNKQYLKRKIEFIPDL